MTSFIRPKHFLVAGALAFGLPLAAIAQADTTDGPGRATMMRAHAGGMHGGPGMMGGPGGRGGMHGRGQGNAGMHGLNLTQEQKDRIFALRHAQAPTVRAKMQEAGNARRELRALSMSDNFDAAKAKALAEQSSKAMAELAVMRASTGNQIYQILTPEQRAQLKARQERRGAGHGPQGGAMRGRGMGPGAAPAGEAPRS